MISTTAGYQVWVCQERSIQLLPRPVTLARLIITNPSEDLCENKAAGRCCRPQLRDMTSQRFGKQETSCRLVLPRSATQTNCSVVFDR